MIVRSPVAEVRQTGRGAQGVRVINLKDGDKLMAAAIIAENEEEQTGDQPSGIESSGDVEPEDPQTPPDVS